MRTTSLTPTPTMTQQSPSNQQVKMAIGPERDSVSDDDEDAFIMERSLGYMTVAKGFLLPESHEKEFDPSEYPSYRPWLSYTATSYTMCSEMLAMIEHIWVRWPTSFWNIEWWNSDGDGILQMPYTTGSSQWLDVRSRRRLPVWLQHLMQRLRIPHLHGKSRIMGEE